MGVTVTRNGILGHCRTLTVACNYTEGEVMVCVLDFKRDVGLWHGILCVSITRFKFLCQSILCLASWLFILKCVSKDIKIKNV